MQVCLCIGLLLATLFNNLAILLLQEDLIESTDVLQHMTVLVNLVGGGQASIGF